MTRRNSPQQSLSRKVQLSFAVFVRGFFVPIREGEAWTRKLGRDRIPRGSYPLPGTH